LCHDAHPTSSTSFQPVKAIKRVYLTTAQVSLTYDCGKPISGSQPNGSKVDTLLEILQEEEYPSSTLPPQPGNSMQAGFIIRLYHLRVTKTSKTHCGKHFKLKFQQGCSTVFSTSFEVKSKPKAERKRRKKQPPLSNADLIWMKKARTELEQMQQLLGSRTQTYKESCALHAFIHNCPVAPVCCQSQGDGFIKDGSNSLPFPDGCALQPTGQDLWGSTCSTDSTSKLIDSTSKTIAAGADLDTTSSALANFDSMPFDLNIPLEEFNFDDFSTENLPQSTTCHEACHEAERNHISPFPSPNTFHKDESLTRLTRWEGALRPIPVSPTATFPAPGPSHPWVPILQLIQG